MKKTLTMVLVLSVMVAMFAVVAPAYAAPDAGKGPGNSGNSGGGGAAGANSTNILSAYMADAAATVLGLDVLDVTASMDAGVTFYDIALAAGFPEADLAALLAEAQALAAANAAADGLSVQIQQQLKTNTAGQFQTNTATQTQVNDGVCDGTGECLQTDPATNLYSGTKTVSKGRRGGR